ncbi:MAG TPA: choice-of-anchor Q domain-containing protein, partial [Solirubrobacter sp.]
MRLRAAFIAVLAALALAAPARADVFTVTSGSSDSTAACSGTTCPSLRAAIAAAEVTRIADTINVPAGTININNDLAVDANVAAITINGASARTNIIDGGAKYRGLRLAVGAVVTMSHFTIRNGAAGQGGSNDGGGVLNLGGQLTLDGVRITGSRAARGGGLATSVSGTTGGSTTITHSLIDGNTASTTGGGVANIGYVETTPLTVLSMSDTTVFNNTASAAGAGGIVAINPGSIMAVGRSTISDNVGGADGGIAGILVPVAARAQLVGSIVARNKTGTSTVNCGAVKPTDGGSNVEDEKDCNFDLGGVDPHLADKLSSEGGEVDVLAIDAGSPAVDRLPVATNCAAGTLDQRGFYRPQGSACDAGAYELDQAATFTITGGPTGTITTDSVQFDFSSNDPTATPVCQLTGPGQSGGFVACYKSNAQPYSGLGNGSYTFSVRDSAFPSGPVTSRTFTVAALDTTITGGPNGPTNNTTPTFTFTGAGGAVSFQCRVDTAQFAACTTPFTTAVLAPGPHTFEVRSQSAAGGVDNTPASRAFTVDTTAPNTTITGGPTGTVASTSATFTYSSTEAGSTFQCALDGAAFAACPAGYTGLAQGTHTFQVRAIDAAGNTDATPATQSWIVDTVAPNTTINS